MGGEPTFVSIDDMDGEEWNTEAVGPEKRRLSELLIKLTARSFRSGRISALRTGEMVSGRVIAALVAGLLLAEGRSANLGGSGPDRRC